MVLVQDLPVVLVGMSTEDQHEPREQKDHQGNEIGGVRTHAD